jgi:hypothetical protein
MSQGNQAAIHTEGPVPDPTFLNRPKLALLLAGLHRIGHNDASGIDAQKEPVI